MAGTSGEEPKISKIKVAFGGVHESNKHPKGISPLKHLRREYDAVLHD